LPIQLEQITNDNIVCYEPQNIDTRGIFAL